MKYVYTEKDLDLISWERIDGFIEKIYLDVRNYLKEKDLKIKYIAPTTFARHLNKWINKAQVKTITPHGFRHSHASLLIHIGCDSRDVADRLGDTVEVVENTYAHLFPEKRSITIKKLNNFKK